MDNIETTRNKMTIEEAKIRLKNLKSDAELYDGKVYRNVHLADSEIKALEVIINFIENLNKWIPIDLLARVSEEENEDKK